MMVRVTPGGRGKRHSGVDYDRGPSFQISTVQRHSPSGSRRQIVMPRPLVVSGVPFGPFMVTVFSLNM